MRGLALLRLKRSEDAAASFQTLIDRREYEFTYPMAFLGVGRAAAQGGDVARARKAYEGFFALWKNADPDVPVLIAARREYSQLAAK